MQFLFDPPPVVAVPILGSGKFFPVHRIYCVGRNYAEHAREFGNNPADPPFFFQKSADAVVVEGHDVHYPSATSDVHYEVEMVVALGGGGRDMPASDALSLVFGYAVGLDLTRRDLQAKAKDLRRPWDVAKSFDESAPIGAIVPAQNIGHPARGLISLDVNGTIRQKADLADMTWKVPDLIANLSVYYELKPGDLIFTGTPAGVGPTVPGDRLHGHIDGVGDLSVSIV